MCLGSVPNCSSATYIYIMYIYIVYIYVPLSGGFESLQAPTSTRVACVKLQQAEDDVRLILKWLACSLPEEALMEILKDVDADMSGTINQREYLRCLRLRFQVISPGMRCVSGMLRPTVYIYIHILHI